MTGPLIAACLATLLAWTWQGALVRNLYGGHWNALFYRGDAFPEPAIPEEVPYIWKNNAGYDGQFYHLIAHDPFLTRGFSPFIDLPRIRYRRILLPLAAWTIALGIDSRIDAAYYSVQLLGTFLGVFWLATYARNRSGSPWWGLAFLAVPAVIVSTERMTVDGLLAAFTIGFVVFLKEKRPGPLYVVLLLACLTRDTGFLLLAGYCCWLLMQRNWRSAGLFATAAVPALAWYAFVEFRTVPALSFFSYPFAGIGQRFLQPVHYPGADLLWIALDLVGLAAVFLASAFSLRGFDGTPRAWTILAFAVLAATTSSLQWTDPYAYARFLSPLLILLAMEGVERNSLWPALPLVLVSVRVAASPASNALRIIGNELWGTK